MFPPKHFFFKYGIEKLSFKLLLYRSLKLLLQKYCTTSLLLFWCPYMAINVSVQCNGGLLPDIILFSLFKEKSECT